MKFKLISIVALTIVVGTFGLVRAESVPIASTPKATVQIESAAQVEPASPPPTSAQSVAPAPLEGPAPTPDATAVDLGHVRTQADAIPATPTEPVYVGGGTWVAPGSSQEVTFTMTGN